MSLSFGSHEETAPEKRILTVRQLNEAISDAMRRAFPGTVWVRGEVQRLPHDAARRTHVYFELHETGQSGAAEYQIPVSLMGWDRNKFGLGRYLDGSDPDFQLANQLEVCLECQVDFYAKFGKLSLKIVGIDKSFALGKLEAQRRATLEFLKVQKLLELNRGIPLPDLPLRVGLITSPGSAAERDFMTGLEGSPFGFQVALQGAKMQGEQLQAEVTRALAALQRQAVDVIVITRGGGSRADLSWFDQKDLAVAIARCEVPVITAIGHEIDQSIADLVAHRACKTPTAAAEFLVDHVQESADRVQEAADRLVEAVADLLEQAGQRVEVSDRVTRAARGIVLKGRLRHQQAAGRLQNLLSAQLGGRRRRLAVLEARLLTRTSAVVGRASALLDRRGLKLGNAAGKILAGARQRQGNAARELKREAVRPLDTRRTALENLGLRARLLDPARLLARGYTITLGPDGAILKSAGSARAGDRLRTRFADGEISSIVQPDGKVPGPAPSGKKSGKGKASDRKRKETNPGQETLFR